MARKFVYDNREYPDPDPSMTVEQVKASMASFFPELANASVKERQDGQDTVYEFEKRLGTKG
ncbi:MAG: PRTRC system protein C [Chloroflexota bacterium]|nr:PRTRC system protein C [Chloroflexota bacterium]